MSNPPRADAAPTLFVLLTVALCHATSAPAQADRAAAKPPDYMNRGASAHEATHASAGAAIATTTIANVPVCTATGDQGAPVMIRNGDGAIVVWTDLRDGGLDIYAQRIGAAGAPEWVIDGVPVCKASGDQSVPRAVPDGAGGAIVVWQDGRGGTTTDIYAQRIDALGVVLWPDGGVPVCTAINAQTEPVVVWDGQGGVVVAWVDDRAGGSDVYAQRVGAGGVAQWGANGVALCTASGVQQGLALVSDGQRGAIVAWQDRRTGTGDIYARRVSESGVVQWGVDGQLLCAAVGEQESVAAVEDGAGGALVVWADGRVAGWDVYGQRVSGSGAVQWGANGVALCTAGGEQRAAVACGDGAGGALVGWQDGRPGAQGQDVYLQRMSGSGVVQWGANGVGVCTAVGDQVGPAVASDPMGGAVVVWSDGRTVGSGADIYAQHVDVGGAVQWTGNGVRLCDAANGQDGARVIADGQGGAAVVWRDYRAGASADLYAQRVDASGQVASQCTPPEALVDNTPVSASAPYSYRTFHQQTFYWSGVGVRSDPGSDWDLEVYDQPGAGASPYPICFSSPLAGSFGTSTVDLVIGNFNDDHTPPGHYGVRASRYSGSSGASIEWDNGPNLITKDGPGVTSPPGWTGVLDVYDVSLTAGVTYWFELNHDPAADIRMLAFTSYGSPDYYYLVPRSARVAESIDRWMSYTPPATERYGVVVVNENGVPDTYNLRVWSSPPVDVSDRGATGATGLRGVEPNPSTGRVQIQFVLHEPGVTAFDVLDMAGRLVARLPEHRRESGAWSVAWDGRTAAGTPAAAGIYFVQMRVDGRRVGLGRLALIR